jgi:hypothetical protein
MKIGYELRDPDEARRFLTQGVWWQRVTPPTAATVRPALEWALEVASSGQPLPPVGFVADLGNAAFGADWENRPGQEVLAAPFLPINLVRTYEDHVLGKLYADWTFGRAGDALRRYQGRDQARGLAFLLGQFRERAGFPGVEMSPGVIKAALEVPPGEVLNQGWESLRQDGAELLLTGLYEGLVAAARRTAEVLGPEDVFQMETGSALADLSHRLAQRQVLQAGTLLEAALPRHRVRPLAHRREVPTRILDEDTYPVGGFTSISTRGSVESLLHSQLAFMEEHERPDLFDIKFVRDELLYYSRDENQFLRRRRTFVFVLHPDLVSTRFKDAELPYQRGVLLLALLWVAVNKLSEWLSTDALSFRVLFVDKGDAAPLAAEMELLRSLLREQIALGTVVLERVKKQDVSGLCSRWARRSLCHCLNVAAKPSPWNPEETVEALLRIDGPCPVLSDAGEEPAVVVADDPTESWGLTLRQVLQRWV